MRRQPLVAAKALRRLIQDPERTEEVFVIMRALSGDAIQRQHAKFVRTEVGQRIEQEQRDILAALSDRTALRHMPEGSLGRAYLAFVERHGITADGLVEASNEKAGEYENLNAQQASFAKRMRDIHDLWHVVCGFEAVPFGEVCVVAFSYAQTTNLGFAVIAAIGALKIARERRSVGVLAAAWQAYRIGKRATWLPGYDWEKALQRPLSEVRRDLNLTEPSRYRSLMAHWSAPQIAHA